MLAVTASRWDADTNQVQKDENNNDKYVYYRMYANTTELDPLYRLYYGGSHQTKVSVSAIDENGVSFDNGTYTYEICIKWTDVPGFEKGFTGEEQVALTMRLAEVVSKKSVNSNYYTIGGDASITNTPSANGVLVVTPNTLQLTAKKTLATMPSEKPDVTNASVGEKEYGEPIVVTSPTHAVSGKYSLWYVDKFKDDGDATTNKNNAQRVKVYMTNDEEFLYVAATMDHAVGKFPTDGHEKPLLIFTAAGYTENGDNPVPQLSEGNDNYHVFRLQFDSADTVKTLSRIRNGTKYSETLDSTAQGSAKYDPNTNTYTYELKIAWENIPGMEDGIFNGKRLAYSMAIRDGNADLTGSTTNTNYRIGGAGAFFGLSKAAPHAGTMMMAMTINAVNGETYATAKVGETYYGSIDRAVSGVSATGGEIVLLNHAEGGELAINNGVTLDLNGKVLTADSVTAITEESYIKDSSNGVGGIKVEKEKLKFIGTIGKVDNNNQLPLYDKDTYRFYDCQPNQLSSISRCKFGFQFTMDAGAYDLLADPKAVGISLKNNMVLTKDDNTIALEYPYNTARIKEYANMKNDGKPDAAISVIVIGFEKVNATVITLKSVPTIVSTTTGVEIAAESQTYTHNVTTKGE